MQWGGEWPIVCGLPCQSDTIMESWFMLHLRTVSVSLVMQQQVSVDVPGSYYPLRPSRCSWSGLLSGTMLIPMGVVQSWFYLSMAEALWPAGLTSLGSRKGPGGGRTDEPALRARAQ